MGAPWLATCPLSLANKTANCGCGRTVPTWNYAAVHACGVPRILSDPEEALALIEVSIRTFEPAYLDQWKGPCA